MNGLLKNSLLTIDPGVKGSGVAHFDLSSKTLTRASYLKHAHGFFHAREELWHWWASAGHPLYPDMPEVVWVEVPRIYPTANQKGDQNDLIEVAMVAAACLSVGSNSARGRYYPRDWKGTLDGDVMTERIEGRLSPVELARVERAGYLTHNVFDAVGIGLKYLGRLDPKKIITRGLAASKGST